MKHYEINNLIMKSLYSIIEEHNPNEYSLEDILKLFKEDMITKLLKTYIVSQFSTRIETKEFKIEDDLIIHKMLYFAYKKKWMPLISHKLEFDITLAQEAFWESSN